MDRCRRRCGGAEGGSAQADSRLTTSRVDLFDRRTEVSHLLDSHLVHFENNPQGFGIIASADTACVEGMQNIMVMDDIIFNEEKSGSTCVRTGAKHHGTGMYISSSDRREISNGHQTQKWGGWAYTIRTTIINTIKVRPGFEHQHPPSIHELYGRRLTQYRRDDDISSEKLCVYEERFRFPAPWCATCDFPMTKKQGSVQ